MGGDTAFVVIFSVILFLAMYEYHRMVERREGLTVNSFFNIVAALLVFYTANLTIQGVCAFALPTTAIVYALALFISALLIRCDNGVERVVYSAFGQLYITVPLIILMLVRSRYVPEKSNIDYLFILSIFLFIWMNDTSAFVVGSLIGKRKLAKHISPKKTIEGFLGSIVFCIILAFVMNRFFQGYGLAFWIGFGLTCSVLSTFGDLFESLIKRTYQVKDAGNIIPGHGGILDRIDSLLMVVPGVYLYLLIISQI